MAGVLGMLESELNESAGQSHGRSQDQDQVEADITPCPNVNETAEEATFDPTCSSTIRIALRSAMARISTAFGSAYSRTKQILRFKKLVCLRILKGWKIKYWLLMYFQRNFFKRECPLEPLDYMVDARSLVPAGTNPPFDLMASESDFDPESLVDFEIVEDSDSDLLGDIVVSDNYEPELYYADETVLYLIESLLDSAFC